MEWAVNWPIIAAILQSSIQTSQASLSAIITIAEGAPAKKLLLPCLQRDRSFNVSLSLTRINSQGLLDLDDGPKA